jgi:general secretion pathway protein D
MTPYAVTPAQPVAQPGAAGSTPSFTDRLRNIIARSGTAQDEFQVLGQTKMIADERTNSLLIYAGKDDMKTIKEIVAKLDVVLAQVLIEAVIVQVGLQDSTSLGVSWLERKPHGGDFFSGIGAIRNGTLATDGAFAAITNSGGGFSYLGRFGDDLNVAITALASDTRAKILQRPRIQTSHNEPASLFVGESRPYPTGSYYGGGAFGGYSSIQQIPIGVTLQVTPLINPDGLVVMEILQDIQAVAGQVTIANVGDVPITSTKNASAIVSVRDRDTIMLGGLIETTREKNSSGVPVLKDVPLLGHLFRSSTDREVRNELIVLIRPTVLPTPEVAALAAKSEKDRMPLVKSADAEFEAMYEKRMREADYEVDKINRSRTEERK